MSIGESIYAWMVANIPALKAQQNKLAQGKLEGQRLWYQRRASETPLGLSGTKFGVCMEDFDFEVIAPDIDQALDTADEIKEALHGFRGDLEGTSVQAIFVEDQADDYLPNGLDDDEGSHVAALDLRIIYNKS